MEIILLGYVKALRKKNNFLGLDLFLYLVNGLTTKIKLKIDTNTTTYDWKIYKLIKCEKF